MEVLKDFDPISQYTEGSVKRLDILIMVGDRSVGIEYDGAYYHEQRFGEDLRKTKVILESLDFHARIREYSERYVLPPLPSHPRYLGLSTQRNSLDQCVEKILQWVQGQSYEKNGIK